MASPGSDQRRRAMRVAVVGGGPAGSFFVQCLYKQAQERGLPVEVTVFEPKKFEHRGAFHCNFCQGVISAGLLASMEKIGLSIPRQVIQARIKSYRLITLGGELLLPVPGNQEIYTVFRGHGPVSEKAGAISFDQFLLDKVLAGGAVKTPVLIREIEIRHNAEDPVTLIDHEGRSYRADVVVGAFGVNSEIGQQFEKLGFGYQSPSTSSALQAEFRTDDDGILRQFGDEIKIFVLGLYPIRFAVITPKRNHITVSLIGQHLRSEHLERFMQHRLVQKHVPASLETTAPRCGCSPLFPISDGRELAAEHCMIIGDSAVSRYYKNGIDSALRSAELAAEVLAEYGPEQAEQLRRYYTRRIKKIFSMDNSLGQVLFRVHDCISQLPSMARAQLEIARGDYGLTGHSRKKLRWLLWNMFTGDASYRKIFLHCLDPFFLFHIILATLRIHFTAGSESHLGRGKDE